MPKSVCKKCEIELRPETNGVKVVEMFQDPPQPYQIWDADLWKCPKCGLEVVLGFANMPFAVHYEDDLVAIIARIKETGVPIIYDYERG